MGKRFPHSARRPFPGTGLFFGYRILLHELPYRQKEVYII